MAEKHIGNQLLETGVFFHFAARTKLDVLCIEENVSILFNFGTESLKIAKRVKNFRRHHQNMLFHAGILSSIAIHFKRGGDSIGTGQGSNRNCSRYINATSSHESTGQYNENVTELSVVRLRYYLQNCSLNLSTAALQSAVACHASGQSQRSIAHHSPL